MFNYLTLGNDCSPAGALRTLNIREFALPFDWIVSSVNALEICFETNFFNFHKYLRFNYNNTRLIDYYGFEFPHDYPFENMSNVEHRVGEGMFGNENNRCISNNWGDYYSIVFDKYSRRIERFLTIMKDNKPIIVLCRHAINDVLKLQELFMKYYNITNIYFVNSSPDPFETDNIINIHTEKDGVWNDAAIWKQGIDNMIRKINSV